MNVLFYFVAAFILLQLQQSRRAIATRTYFILLHMKPHTFGYLLSRIRLSVVCPSSVVCNVRAPYSAG